MFTDLPNRLQSVKYRPDINFSTLSSVVRRCFSTYPGTAMSLCPLHRKFIYIEITERLLLLQSSYNTMCVTISISLYSLNLLQIVSQLKEILVWEN